MHAVHYTVADPGGGGSEGLTHTGGHSVECMHAVHYTVADPGGGGGVRGFNTDRGS